MSGKRWNNRSKRERRRRRYPPRPTKPKPMNTFEMLAAIERFERQLMDIQTRTTKPMPPLRIDMEIEVEP